MNVQSLVDDVETSTPYQKWRESHPEHSFLASLFAIVEEEKPISWHVNYYTPGTEKATTFTTFPEIERQDDSEIAGDEPKPLDADQATLSFPEILELATDAMAKEFPSYTYAKVLATLHQQDGKATWNLSVITAQGQTVIIQMSAQDGTVFSQKALSLKDFNVL